MADRLLLDTCAAIWIVEDVPISTEAEESINRAAAEAQPVYLGLFSSWERAMLSSKQRLTSPLSPRDWWEQLVARPEIEVIPLTSDILIDSCFLPGDLHRDPADRILIATARALRLTIVTRDERILEYAGKGHVRAIAC